LQECHTTADIEKEFTKQWGENCFFSHSTSWAKGTCIIIPETVNFVLDEVHKDEGERYIIVHGNFNNRNLSLVNMYAPTQDKTTDQINTYNKVIGLIKDSIHNLIWTGDFNIYMDSSMDHFNNTDSNESLVVQKLKTFMESAYLLDVWRTLNPNKIRYTWRKYGTRGIAQSRLDYFVVSTSLLYDVKSCEIENSFLSDHNIISLELNANADPELGKGTWKFNVSLLNDPEYVKSMNLLLEECNNNYNDIKDRGLRWDVIKCQIRGFTISYSSFKSKQNKQTEKELIQKVKTLEKKCDQNPNDNIIQELTTCKNELEQFESIRTKGMQIRARCQHIDNYESNTSYFFSQEKAHAQAKSMKTMIREDGTISSNLNEISQEQNTFYKNLYQEPKMNERSYNEASEFFTGKKYDIDQIPDHDRELLDQPMSDQELTEALKLLKNGKSPGSDGLVREFYIFFWNRIKNLVCDSLKSGLDTGKLSIDQRRAILTLLPKKDKDARYIKNWRPLSLLNTDYKILAKALALRLQTYLPDIINTDQSGCIKGRSTFSNIRSTIDIMNYAKEHNIPGYIAFIDYEKAFDTVKWKFLYKCLERMNFGDYYINCIKTLYKDIGTHVSNCGHLGEQFSPSRGIRQGCPISANLFVLVVEMLANAIRQNPRIIGIQIGNKTYKITQYADDTCIYVSDYLSLQTLFSVVDLFTRCSGLKVNRDKSEAMGIGACSNFRHKTLGIKWPKESIKCLGVYLHTDDEKMIEDNFNQNT
jgi:exonuclease III